MPIDILRSWWLIWLDSEEYLKRLSKGHAVANDVKGVHAEAANSSWDDA